MKIENITNYVTNKFKMQIAIKVIVKFVIVPRKRNYIKIYKIQKLALLLFYNRGNANDITSNRVFQPETFNRTVTSLEDNCI